MLIGTEVAKMTEFCPQSMMPSKYILITGGNGFVGSHTATALEKAGFGARTYDIADGEDILNMAQLFAVAKIHEAKRIIHLAGQVNLMPSLQNPQNDAMLNIIGTLNVLEVARRLDCGVTFSSSGAVYGNNYQYPDPVSPYGVSKLTAENYCRLYNKLYGLNTVVYRFSSVYGIGRAPTSINLILAKAMRGETIKITGDGNQTRDFTYVKDVAEALVMSVKNVIPSGVYDIGTGTATSLNELIELIGRLLGKEIKTEYIRESVGDPKRNELNVSKIAFYGFKAKTSLEDGLKMMIKRMKK